VAFFDYYAGVQLPPTSLGLRQEAKTGREIARRILACSSQVKPSLLEIGPGRGHFARNVGSLFEYHAVEGNAQMAESMRKDGFDVENGNVPGLSTEDTYDVIYFAHVFEHVDSLRDQLTLLRECRLALKPGGIVVIIAPDYGVWRERFFLTDYSHNMVTAPHRTRMMLIDEGFEIVHEACYAFGMWGRPATRLLDMFARTLDCFGLLELAAGKRYHKVRSSLCRNFMVIARKVAS
jgi:SAM-dependent methyltransferase